MFQFQGQGQGQGDQFQFQRQIQLPPSFSFEVPKPLTFNPIEEKDFDLKIPNRIFPVTYPLSKQQGVISTHLDIISELWITKKLCDVTLIVEEEKFQVHKIMLASHVPYFREMFSNDKYQECNAAEIKLSDLDPKIMSFILGYIYGRKLEITEDNLVKFLHHADYFMMKDLKDWCEEKLMNTVTEKTCVEYFLLSRRYKLPALKNKTILYFNKHSDLLSFNEDFLTLSKEEFSVLWSEAEDAESGYLALMKWVKHNLDNRKGFLHELLQNIPQDEISVGFFKDNMAEEELLKENLQCCLWLLELTTSLLTAPPAYDDSDYDSDSD